jgi:hypothetical protein
MRRIWSKRGAGDMKGRKTLRRAGVVLGFGALLCAGVMASGAFGMHLDAGIGTTDSSSTATDTAPPPSDSTATDTTASSSTSTDTTPTTTDTTPSTTTAPASTTPSPQVYSPTIQSDQADYSPGSTVTLTGSGWAPSDAVHIFVNDDVGQTWSYSADVAANGSGGFTVQFQLPASFVANYRVTATGASGNATTTFTDASLKVYPRPAASGVTFTLTIQGFADSACSTGGGSTATQTISNDTGGENINTGGSSVLNGKQFVKFSAPTNATTPSGWTFKNWSSHSPSDNVITTTTNSSICVRIPTGGNNDAYDATYKPSATLTVIKSVVNNNGGTAVASNFAMSVTGANANPSSFPTLVRPLRLVRPAPRDTPRARAATAPVRLPLEQAPHARLPTTISRRR